MATAPRTLKEAQATSSSSSELAWWVFMRVSGLLLVFLTFGHLWANNIAMNAGEIDYAYVVERLARPSVKVFDSFLLGLAMLHGMNGLRYSIQDYIRRPGRRAVALAVLYTVFGVILVLGVITLWAFDFEEMGEAIRALNADAP